VQKLVLALHNFVVYLRSCAIVNMQGLQIMVHEVNYTSTVCVPVSGVSGRIK
jgi:hypothetical protein